MTVQKRTIKKPPEKTMQNLQYELFSCFVTNDTKEVSNTVEIWESIPKYFFTPKQVEKLRTASGHADPYKWEYYYKNIPCMVRIQPALIEQKDGSYKAFFPSITEEFVEEALKKIFTEQQYGIHDAKNSESWVKFSLNILQKELKMRGRSRNISEIKAAIDVMSNCIITLFTHGKEIWKGAILQDLITIGRNDYLADTNSYHYARLPLLISQSINHFEYRQFNYDRLMSCNEQLTRWIYKQLIHRFKQASLMNTYHFMYSNLARDSGLLQQGNDRRNRQKVISALDELVECKIILFYKEENIKDSKKVIDVKYTLTPSPYFISEQKAANKRSKDVIDKATEHSLIPKHTLEKIA